MSGIPPPKRPPPKPMQKGKIAALSRVLDDKQKIDELKAKGEASMFFDKDSFEVRRRRTAARTEYEFIIDSIYPDQDPWAKHTIIEYTKTYLSTAVEIIKGRIDDKPRTDSLYQRKEALYWWSIRMIPEFASIFMEWHTSINSHIGYLGITLGLSKEHREKENLTDLEMGLLFDFMMAQTSSVPNWKQHYLAWLMVWTTSIRPGSFTVCPGYEKGADMGADDIKRAEDETLRWCHLTFNRVDGNVIVRCHFKYNKGQRNPYTQRMMSGNRKFTFNPCSGDRYHLDVATLLVALGLERGLFAPVTTYEELMAIDRFDIAKDPVVESQAVFVASEVGKNTLNFEKPMREAALNPALQLATTSVGLWLRNTMYSLRRTAILETKRQMGTEFAQEVAGHKPGGAAILVYDNVGLSDVDITALRLGETGGPSREQIRAIFSQVNTSRVDITPSLQAEMDEFVQSKMRADNTYVEAENALLASLQAVWTHFTATEKTLESAQRLVLAANDDNDEVTSLRTELQTAVSKRKDVRKTLRKRYATEFRTVRLENHKKELKAINTRTGATHSHGRLPKQLAASHQEAVSQARPAVQAAGQQVNRSIENLQADNERVDEEAEDVDLAAISDHDPRGEPSIYAEVPDDVEIEVPADTAIVDTSLEASGSRGRAAFIHRFLRHRDIPTTDLPCLLCQLDGTVPADQKNLKWHRKADLDRHLASNYHTLAEQRKRAKTG